MIEAAFKKIVGAWLDAMANLCGYLGHLWAPTHYLNGKVTRVECSRCKKAQILRPYEHFRLMDAIAEREKGKRS